MKPIQKKRDSRRGIDIWTEPLPPQYRWTPETPLSGTTKTYVRLAEELTKRDHSVVVYYDGPQKRHNGVSYASRADFLADSKNQNYRADVVLDINAIGPFKGRKRLHQTSLYKSRAFLNPEVKYDHVFLLSEFHKSTVLSGVDRPDVSILPLGCDFETVAEPRLVSRPKLCAYTASPDRGLGLLHQIWPEVKEKTGYDLATTPYAADVSEEEIRQLLLTTRFWVHPAAGVELYCLTAVEAQACGAVPVYVPHMALAETVRYGVKTDLHRFKDDLIRTLNTPETALPLWEDIRAEALTARPLPKWADAAAEIEKHF